MRILVVEDDELLADSLCQLLTGNGFSADHVTSGTAADALLSNSAYDMAILDIGLPGIDGFEVLRRLRKRANDLPVLVLTARDTVEDRVHGLNLGADDYLPKPFAGAELEARVRALLRRRTSDKSGKLVHGDLVLDTIARRAWLRDKPLDLTLREWSLLEYLLSRAGHVVSKSKLVDAICTWDQDITPNAVEVYLSRLRSKLDGNVEIRTVRGFGYLIEPPTAGSTPDQ
jgi:two-component system, OmpR family, response regulator